MPGRLKKSIACAINMGTIFLLVGSLMKGFYRGFSEDLSCGQQENLPKMSSQEEKAQIGEVIE